MRKARTSTLMIAAGLAGMTFRRDDRDPFAVREPVCGGGQVCGITSARVGREAHLMAEGDQGGGGAGVTFTPEQQAKVDAILKDRLGKKDAEIADLKKAGDAMKAEFEGLKGKLDELTTAAEKAREEGELKGLSEAQKLQVQFDKAQKTIKDNEAAYQRKLAEAESAKKAVESEKELTGKRLTDFVKRTVALSALAGGLAEGASDDAVVSFLSSAELDLDENLNLKTILFGGRTFDKPDEAASAFFTAKPHFAKAPPGGSGGPRNGSGNGAPDPTKATPAELFRAGFSQPTKPMADSLPVGGIQNI